MRMLRNHNGIQAICRFNTNTAVEGCRLTDETTAYITAQRSKIASPAAIAAYFPEEPPGTRSDSKGYE